MCMFTLAPCGVELLGGLETEDDRRPLALNDGALDAPDMIAPIQDGGEVGKQRGTRGRGRGRGECQKLRASVIVSMFGVGGKRACHVSATRRGQTHFDRVQLQHNRDNRLLPIVLKGLC